MKQRLEQLKAEIDAWAHRPPRRSAARARADVLAAMGSREERWGWWRTAWRWRLVVAASSGVAAALVIAVVLAPGSSHVGSPTGSMELPERLAASQLVLELSSGTRLYLMLSGETNWDSDIPRADTEGDME